MLQHKQERNFAGATVMHEMLIPRKLSKCKIPTKLSPTVSKCECNKQVRNILQKPAQIRQRQPAEPASLTKALSLPPVLVWGTVVCDIAQRCKLLIALRQQLVQRSICRLQLVDAVLQLAHLLPLALTVNSTHQGISMPCQLPQALSGCNYGKGRRSRPALGAHAHREVAAVARFLARRRCLRRSAGSLIVDRSTSGLRLPMRGSFFADVGDREPVKSLHTMGSSVEQDVPDKT